MKSRLFPSGGFAVEVSACQPILFRRRIACDPKSLLHRCSSLPPAFAGAGCARYGASSLLQGAYLGGPILLQEDIVPQANEGSITLQGNAVTQAWSSAPRIPCSTMSFETPATLAGRISSCKRISFRRRMACHSKPLLHPLASRKNPSISFVTLWVRIDIRADNRMPAGSDHQFRRATVYGFAHPDG